MEYKEIDKKGEPTHRPPQQPLLMSQHNNLIINLVNVYKISKT